MARINKRNPLVITGMPASGCEALGAILSCLKIVENSSRTEFPNSDTEWRNPLICEAHDRILLALCGRTPNYECIKWGFAPEHGFNDQFASELIERELRDYWNQYQLSSSPKTSLSGWCEPRSTILLDFYRDIYPEARVIAVYREPWTTAHLLREIEPELFLSKPQIAFDLWLLYNQKILDFKSRCPDNCLLVHCSALEKSTAAIIDWVNRSYSTTLPHTNITAKVRGSVTSGYADWPYELLYEEIYPEINACWKKLNALAELPGCNAGHHESEQSLRLAQPSRSSEVAIIIPTYNQGHLLVDCIASAEQSLSNSSECLAELIVIDDGTSDHVSKQILDRFSRMGYNIIRTPNRGLASARNTGIAAASAPFILPLDDDNLLHEGYLQSGLRILSQNSDIAAVYGDREDFGLEVQIFKPGVVFFDDIWRINVIDACALIRKSWLQSCGGYDTGLEALEDWDLWLNILTREGRLFYLSEVCFSYCHRPRSMTSRIQESSKLLQHLVEYIQAKYSSTS